MLLRGVLPYKGTENLNGDLKKPERLLNGPAKLVKSIGIPFDMYGKDLLSPECELKIYDAGLVP